MSPEEQLIDDLRRKGFTLYLGGSRRMAERFPTEVLLKSSTDYDYYATHSNALEQAILSNKDFEVTDDPARGGYPCDTEVVKIVRHLDLNLQIVLRKDAEFYRTVFESITSKFYLDHLWKSSPRYPDSNAIMPIFDALFATAHAMEARPSATPPAPVKVCDPLKAYEYAMKGIK